MRNNILTQTALTIVLTGSIFPGATAPTAKAAVGLLDGRIYSGEVGPKGKPADSKDDIIFSAGTLHSTACNPYGFESGTYSTVREGGKIRFRAITESPTDGTIEWNGTVEGDRLTGTFKWRKGLFRRSYWLDAKLKK